MLSENKLQEIPVSGSPQVLTYGCIAVIDVTQRNGRAFSKNRFTCYVVPKNHPKYSKKHNRFWKSFMGKSAPMKVGGGALILELKEVKPIPQT